MVHRRLLRTAALGLALGALAAPPSASQQDLRGPDSRDPAPGRGTLTAPDVTVVKVSAPSPPRSGSIDWADAAIGAGALLGLILLGAGVALIAVRRRRIDSSFPGPTTRIR